MGRNMMSAMKRLIKRKSFDEKAAMPDLFAAHQQLATAAAETDGNGIIAVGVTRSTKKEPSQKLAEIEKDKVGPLKQKSVWLAEDIENSAGGGENAESDGAINVKKLQARLKQLNESAMRLLEELDAIEISSDTTDEQQYQKNREQRKAMVVEIQALLDKHDGMESDITTIANALAEKHSDALNNNTNQSDANSSGLETNAIVECCA